MSKILLKSTSDDQNVLQEIFDNHKQFTDIAERRSAFFEEISRALIIVRDFILHKKRIIYGGMSIDFNLKMSGHPGIYTADVIPDYDFMSPDFYNDSNELGDILALAGFTNVSVINAAHLQTRRVRINFIPVADITYISPNIYDNLPYLEYKEVGATNRTSNSFKTIHPDFQRLDFTRAFTLPFEGAPQEVFAFRSRKDQKRSRMLAEAYPIVISPIKASVSNKDYLIPVAALQGCAIGGFLAYGFYYEIYQKLLASTDISELELLPIHCSIANDHIKLSWPEGLPEVIPPVNIISDTYETTLKMLKLVAPLEWYNRYLDDFRPRTVMGIGLGTVKYEIYDNLTRKIPVFDLSGVLEWWKLPSEKGLPPIVSAQHALLYFLLKSFEYPDMATFYRQMYVSLEHMVITAEKKYIQDPNADLFKQTPFFLTANTYGRLNASPNYLSTIREKIAMITGQPYVSERPVFGYYPCVQDGAICPGTGPAPFEPSFQTDGQLRSEPFEPIIFPQFQ